MQFILIAGAYAATECTLSHEEAWGSGEKTVDRPLCSDSSSRDRADSKEEAVPTSVLEVSDEERVGLCEVSAGASWRWGSGCSSAASSAEACNRAYEVAESGRRIG